MRNYSLLWLCSSGPYKRVTMKKCIPEDAHKHEGRRISYGVDINPEPNVVFDVQSQEVSANLLSGYEPPFDSGWIWLVVHAVHGSPQRGHLTNIVPASFGSSAHFVWVEPSSPGLLCFLGLFDPWSTSPCSFARTLVLPGLLCIH